MGIEMGLSREWNDLAGSRNYGCIWIAFCTCITMFLKYLILQRRNAPQQVLSVEIFPLLDLYKTCMLHMHGN